MCSLSLLCPLCSQTIFPSVDALRGSLIKAANGPLSCPICQELFLGLDKLTIHLFSHNNNINVMAASTSSLTATTITIIQAAATPTISNITEIASISTANNIQATETNNELENATESVMMSEMVNFENIHHQHHHHHSECESKQNENINNFDSMQQQQQQQQLLSLHTTTTTIANTTTTTTTTSTTTSTTSTETTSICNICEFTFSNELLRDIHLMLAHENYHISSGTLNDRDNSLNSFDMKSKSKTTECEFRCHLCTKSFRLKGSLRVHLKVVHSMDLPCTKNNICDRIKCKRIAANNDTLTDHFKCTKTGYFCSVGDKVDLLQLSPHIVRPNPALQTVNYMQGEYLINGKEDNEGGNINATPPSHCHHNFNLDQLTPIQADRSNIKNCDKNSFNSVNTAATDNINPKIWECEVCSKCFTTKYFLKKHKRLHTGEMPYTCEICGRTFTFQQSYHKHLLYHSDEKPHICQTCGRAFKELSTLHNHERIHSGEKPFKCEVCGKCFRQRVSFLVHTRIHTGVMPYKCEMCHKSFRYKVSQRTHKCQMVVNNEQQQQQQQHCTQDNLDQISENVLKSFFESVINTKDTETQIILQQEQHSPTSSEVAAITSISTQSKQNIHSSQSVNSINKEANKEFSSDEQQILSGHLNNEERSLSHNIEQMQNMRIYSPQLLPTDLNMFDGDLTRFLLDNSEGSLVGIL